MKSVLLCITVLFSWSVDAHESSTQNKVNELNTKIERIEYLTKQLDETVTRLEKKVNNSKSLIVNNNKNINS